MMKRPFLFFLAYLVTIPNCWGRISCARQLQYHLDVFYPSKGHLSEAIEMQDSKKLIQKAHERMSAGITGDIPVQLSSLELARKYVYNFIPLKKFGFPTFGPSTWSKFISNMKNSKLFGKRVGYFIKNEDGSWARIRLDWDPANFGHYNIEMRIPTEGGKMETVQMMVKFPCGQTPCSEDEVVKMANQLQ